MVVDRLRQEFPHLPAPHVIEVVQACRRDIDAGSSGAMAELVERLARQRLGNAP